MAEIPKINVAVETAVHNVFANAAQRILEDYGVRVNQVVIEWSDSITSGDPYPGVSKVRMNTEKEFDMFEEPLR